MSTKQKSKRKPAGKTDRKRFHLDKRAALILKATADADAEDLLSPKEAAVELGVSEVWLAKRRLHGDGPPYERLSPHCIKYRRSRIAPGSNSDRSCQPLSTNMRGRASRSRRSEWRHGCDYKQDWSLGEDKDRPSRWPERRAAFLTWPSIFEGCQSASSASGF